LLLAQESAGLAILDWVISSNTFIHSENFADVFDLAPRAPGEALTGAMLIERVHPEDLDSLLGEFSRESLSARDFEKEFRIVCRDRSVRWIQSRGRLFSGASGLPERMLSLNYDITARKTSEHANAELAAIVASSIDAIIGVDPLGMITTWNAGADRMLGVHGGLIGHRVDDLLSGVAEADRAAFHLAPGEPSRANSRPGSNSRRSQHRHSGDGRADPRDRRPRDRLIARDARRVQQSSARTMSAS
jgi:PAS fold.